MNVRQEIVKIADNENFTSHIEFLEGNPFLHVDVHQWSKESMGQMQVLFDMVVEKCEENNIPILSFYGSENSVKMAKSFAPLDHLEQVEDSYIGCWYV